jgi:glycosyltransferase family protein
MVKILKTSLIAILRPFKLFLNNVSFLFRYKLEDHYVSIEQLNIYLDNIKYEINDDINTLTRPQIESPLSTIETILNRKTSVCRFGDGEFELLEGKSIGFQKSSALLTKRLHEVLISDHDNILICLPQYFWYSVKNCNPLIKSYARGIVSGKRPVYETLLNKDKFYYATEFTQLYMTYSAETDLTSYFGSLKLIWLNKDITIIQGKGITKNFKYDLFDNALSVEHMYAPSKDAFFNYDEILKNALNINKDRLVLIILGPTATILAYDLAMMGYQAIDLGHTAKDYEYYRSGAQKTPRNISKFYEPD